jgi:hypothetical protein
VNSLQAALRARHAEADWITVVKPINDSMRAQQRDALVAFVLQHLGDRPETSDIDTPDKLFEYFLMDVEMMPCSATSRVRLALSSIQLFIERALRGLELEVDATHIKADQWEWMKRYRVWQANREVFLWPENWADPSLRDDPSPFFKDAMGALLQGDITDESAAAAYLSYLTALEDVAKLEPCGIHYDRGSGGAADDVVHVVARTAGAKRKHYYRKQQFGTWTAWEEIKVDIEDHPVVPFVWDDRLLLFWVRILKQPDTNGDKTQAQKGSKPKKTKRASGDQKLTDMSFSDLHTATQSGGDKQVDLAVQAVLCWSERYNGAWQAIKTSDVNAPITLGKFPHAGRGAFNRSLLRLRVAPQSGGRLMVDISLVGTPAEEASGFILYNTHSLPVLVDHVPGSEAHLLSEQRAVGVVSSRLRVTYEANPRYTQTVIEAPLPSTVVEPQPGPGTPRNAPFLFEDRKGVFYVTTDEVRHWVATFKGFGFGRAPHLHGQEHHFPPLDAPGEPHHPRHGALPVVYGGTKIGHAGSVKHGPEPRRRKA